ncbi:hypothetical protein Tco_1219079 [Tanacetum coccineum]
MSHEIMHIAVNFVDILDVQKSCVSECNKCLELETELLKKKDLIEKDVYDKLLKSYSTLEKHCISLELTTQLNQEVFQKDNFHQNQNAPTFNQLFELNELKAQSQEKDTTIRKLKDRIKSLSGKDSLENVKKDIDEIETINIELEHSVEKLLSENESLRKEREHLKSIYKDQFDSIRKTCVQSKEQSFKTELRKLKGKHVVDTAVSKPNDTIALGMFKLDIEPISLRLMNNKDAHKVYIEKTIEYTDTLRVYVSQTCPNSPKHSDKLVVVTPMNKDKRVRFTEPVTTLSNIPKQTNSLKTKDSKKPLLTSTGVKPTTSASGSKPSGNIKNNRITRPSSSNKKNKVEDHSRKVKSSLNKTNSVSKHVSNTLVKHYVRNTKFESICAICNKCLFDANHDMCIIDSVNDVNVHSKSKSKRNKMRKVWKPTGKVFNETGYSWKPTGIDQIVLLEVGIDQHFSASSWNRPNLVPASSRKGCWELLLSHRRLFLENKGQICNGDPRQSMDLINQHGLNSLKIIHNAGPSLEIIHKNGDLGILDSGNVSRADRLIRRNWMGLCEDCRGELQNIKLVLCFNKFVIQKQVLFMLKCVLFSLRSSNYLRIVRWFSEFQEGNNLYCFNLSDIKLEEMSPVCWPIASLVSLP